MRRREFALTLAGLSAGCASSPRLSPSLELLPGPINTILLRRNGRTLAINGDASAAARPDELLFTHHRRDVVEPARPWITAGAPVAAPAAERNWFSGAREYWDGFRTARFHDYGQYTTKILAQPISAGRWLEAPSAVTFEDVEIQVIPTPGYTRGAASYVFDVDGKRFACTGDLIYAGGRVFDLYSLQEAIPETGTRGYHGFAARSAQLLESLDRIAALAPDVILPVRGEVIENPQEAIAALKARILRLFQAYFRTDALRWYWGEDNLRTRARRILGATEPQWMEMATEIQQTAPRWVRKFGTSRLLISEEGPAFLLDCGSDQIMADIEQLQRSGAFTKIEGIFVTHFHDDHTDRVQAMRQKHDCPVYSGEETKDILENPDAYHMPAMTDIPIQPVTGLAEGHTWRWREFTFKQTYFPGQALYHGGLLAERDSGETYFFIGDSFSPSGLDDYCLLNRHFFHPGWGHFLCLDKVEELQKAYLLANQHIDEAFRYGPEQLATLREVLKEKRAAMADLVPWDDPNYGADEQWVKLYPYGQTCRPGESITLYPTVFNHSAQPRQFTVQLHAPAGWRLATDTVVLEAAPLKQSQGELQIKVPQDASGFEILTATVTIADRTLPHWTESIITIAPQA